MRKLLAGVILFLIINNVYSQQAAVDTTKQESPFLSLIYANRQLTYFTFFQGLGNLPPLLTEMGFSGSYFLKRNNIWALEANLNMVLRIRNETSFPVSPPSYNPVLTYYRDINRWKSSFMSKLLLDHAYWELSVGHHSNGKAGQFYILDSLGNTTKKIDLDNANFSTDYLEGGFTTFSNRKNGTNGKFISSFRLAFRMYPEKLSSKELKDMYGFYRMFASYNIFGFPWGANHGAENFFTKSRLRLHSGWIFGKISDSPPDEAKKRLIADVTWFYYPGWLAEIGFFIQYYRGQDYYNVQFRRTVEMFRIGISSNPINFGILNDL
ncbi:MAG: hypothetical protein WD555_01885 [Fulvivirga sp.]